MNNKKVLYTGGTYDIFHFGHTNFLKQCAMMSDEVIVALNTDEFISQFKGQSPIMTYKEREKSLLNCPFVDKVIPNLSGQDSKPTILSVRPNIVAIGDDWAHKDYYKQMQFTQQWLEENKIVLVYIPYTRGISTSEIKSRILQEK
jgi:glycerol-3-phosphate cytidylyltransferase